MNFISNWLRAIPNYHALIKGAENCCVLCVYSPLSKKRLLMMR